jgi:hypothetical protein
MAKKQDLTALLAEQETPRPIAANATADEALASHSTRMVHKPGEVNISAYFNPEVKAALRHVQAKTGKNIKACLAEALQLLFRKYNVPVTVPED